MVTEAKAIAIEIKDIVTVLRVLLAAVSLVFTAINTRLTLSTNQARFWLDLRERFSKHDPVHKDLLSRVSAIVPPPRRLVTLLRRLVVA